MKEPDFPAGWDAERVRRVMDRYEHQTEDEAMAEDEAAFDPSHTTVMEIPAELVPDVRALLASHQK